MATCGCGFFVLVKALGVLFLGDFGGGSFAEHGEDEFQIRHVVAEVLAWIGERFEGFVFGGCHAEGGLADLGGENGKFARFFDAAFFPLVSKFVTDGDAAKAFFDPFLGVAFLLVNLAHPAGCEFGVFDFLKAFISDLGEPEFERFSFG